MIKLYHGSNVNIDSIGTCYCLSEKGMTQQQKIEILCITHVHIVL